MPETTLRAADTDRATVAEVLGTAMRDGRLTVEEYDERLAAAAPTSRAAYGSCSGDGDLRGAWRAWTTVALIVCAVWVVGPWGAVLLARALGTRGSLARR